MSEKLKNIIIVYDCADINGGAANVAIQSAIALSSLDFNVYFFAATGPINENLKKSKVQVKCLDLNDINHGSKLEAVRNGIWNKTVRKEFDCFLSDFSSEETIVHIHGWAKALSSAVVKVACKKGFKTIITLHDYFTLCPNGGFYDYQKKKICSRDPMSVGCMFCNCDKRNYPQKMWRVTRQIVQDKNVRRNPNISFISISQKNEQIVKPYVKTKDFYRVDNPIQLADSFIEDCSKSNRFLYVGRLSDEKGIELFCQAVKDIKKEHKVEGIVVGDGDILEKLRDNYPEIQFEGWKSSTEVKTYIKSARALVLPSKWYEGAPLTIIEAMSSGLPCIVSDCTSAVELIRDGENGYVFESGNLESLKEKMMLAMKDEIKLIQEKVKDFDYGIYDANAHVKKLLLVYEDILNGHRR